MSYVESNLMDNEDLIHKSKVHWIVYIPPLFWLLIFMLCFFSFYGVASMSTGDGSEAGAAIFLTIMVFISGFASFIGFIKAWIERFSTELAITSKRVIAKTGLIKRDTVELNHSKVESFTVHQSILGRILNYGTVVINGTGGIETPIPKVTKPLIFRRKAMEVIDQ